MPITTFRIKEKFWFWDADFWIQDEKGTNVYKLSQRAWYNANLSLKESNTDNERIVVRKPLFSINKDYFQMIVPQEASKSTSLTSSLPEAESATTTTTTTTTAVSGSTKVVPLAELKEKKAWFQSKHVLTLDKNFEYTVDATKWRSHSTFSMQSKGFTIAHVHKKRMDLTGSLWVDINVEPDDDGNHDNSSNIDDAAQVHGDLCLAVLVACLLMLRILHQQEKRAQKRERQEALDKMPLQSITKRSRA